MSNQQIRPEIVNRNKIQNTKTTRGSLEHSAVASDADLDGILSDVEKIEATSRYKDKLKQKSSIKFTKEDEDDLDQIFDDVERRKKGIEDILVAVKSSGNDSDDCSSESSICSSADSSDSELNRLLDDVESLKELKYTTMSRSAEHEEKEMDREMDKILDEVEAGQSKKLKKPKRGKLRLKTNKTTSSSSSNSKRQKHLTC
jgi:hypothetical protein